MQREMILSKLTMRQILEFYAPRKIHRNRCACPLHNGKDDNFVIYHDSFYCWVCGCGGDFIKFVSLLLNIPYPEAMKRIDADFALGVYKKPTLSQHRENMRQLEKYRKKAAEEEKAREERFSEYRRCLKERDACLEALKKYAPKEEDEGMHPEYAEALHKLAYINTFFETFDERGG